MGLFSKKGGNKENKGGRLKQALEMAKPALNLSADQEQKISEIFKNFREERQNLKKDGGDNMRDDVKAARQQTRQQLMALLNSDQKRILEENLQKLKGQE